MGLKIHGVETMVVIAEDESGGIPGTEYCNQYATTRDIDPSLVYVDTSTPPGSFAAVWGNVAPNDGGSVSMPWQAVLRGADMQYTWRSSDQPGSAEQAIEDIIGQ